MKIYEEPLRRIFMYAWKNGWRFSNENCDLGWTPNIKEEIFDVIYISSSINISFGSLRIGMYVRSTLQNIIDASDPSILSALGLSLEKQREFLHLWNWDEDGRRKTNTKIQFFIDYFENIWREGGR